LHIAQIGTGRVGRPTAYTILCSKLADKLTVCDIKPGLATAFAEELRHVTVSLGIDVEIIACEKAEDVNNAEIILISAGKPRTPGVKMTRSDLANENGAIVKQIAQSTVPNNLNAKYVVITNPVDSMAMICKKYSKAKYVISTGTNLETLRFKAALSKALNVPPSKMYGWIGGEHGPNATVLWSTVKVDELPLEEYLLSTGKSLNKKEIEDYVKSVSKMILDTIGATEHGPAASFRDIIKAIVKDTHELFPIAAPTKIDRISQSVFVSIPRSLGKSIGNSIFQTLSIQEKNAINNAASSIFQTYKNTTV
jgi:malate dehydrogenase